MNAAGWIFYVELGYHGGGLFSGCCNVRLLRGATKFPGRLHRWRKAEKNEHWPKYNSAVDIMRKKYKRKDDA